MPQLLQFHDKPSAENGKPAPRFGIEVFVIEMETRGVAFAFPLVAAPEGEESLDPCGELAAFVLRELEAHVLPDFHR